MLAMFLVLLIAVGNFALGFALAAHFGHGPAWIKLPGGSGPGRKPKPAAQESVSSAEAGH